jgi:hypothetical protein
MTDPGSDGSHGYASFSRSLPPEDPPDWVDGAPTSSRDQTCAICGLSEVTWVHPLTPELIEYRVYGKGHTLPTFWCLCQRCEVLHRAGAEPDLIEIMKFAPGWYWDSEDQIDELLGKPLAVFRRADKGARRLTTG